MGRLAGDRHVGGGLSLAALGCFALALPVAAPLALLALDGELVSFACLCEPLFLALVALTLFPRLPATTCASPPTAPELPTPEHAVDGALRNDAGDLTGPDHDAGGASGGAGSSQDGRNDHGRREQRGADDDNQ
ncbi:MAG TPA: hypothetical protein VK891_07495 [Euzebyales bacterium]|nr:hypothetical protein [Euzebyales bacterium]